MRDGGRKESFEIADDEQLIGCRLDEGKDEMDDDWKGDQFLGVMWIKMKLY